MRLNYGAREDSRVPWTARRSNQSILKEINPKYSLEGLMLKLNLQCFSHLMEDLTYQKRLWCWERLKAKGEGGRGRGWNGFGITDSMDMNLSKPQETMKDRKAWPPAVHGVARVRYDLATEQHWISNTLRYFKVFYN